MRIVVLLRCNIPRFKLFYLTAFFDVAYTEISPVSLACVASVYNRVTERKFEREQKKSFLLLLSSQISRRTRARNACYAG